MTMKMAKASERDMDAALELMVILQSVDSGYYPSSDDDDDVPIYFDENDPEHLLALYNRIKSCLDEAPGGLGRVIAGMQTIMHNDILDPDKDYLSLHPRLVATPKASD